MYRPKRLIVKNFQSFENLDYTFKQGIPISVEGENLTDDGQESNGSGKSCLGEILYYALLGSSSVGKRDVKLISWGEKEAFISFELENTFQNHILKIERELFANGSSSKLRIYIDNVDQKDKFSGVNEGNKYILSLLDISADDLKNYHLINREKFVSFFTSSDTAKRSLIGRFSSADKVSGSEDLIKNEIKPLETEIKKYEVEISVIEGKIQSLEESIQAEKDKYSDEKFKEEKEKKELEIQSYRKRIIELQEEIKENNESLPSIELQEIEGQRYLNIYEDGIRRVNKIDYDSEIQKVEKLIELTSTQINGFNTKISELEVERQEFEKEVKPLELVVAGKVTCPSCKFVFAPNSSIPIKEAEELIPLTYVEINRIKKEIEVVNKQKEFIRAKEYSLLQTSLSNLKKQKQKARNLTDRYSSERKNIINTIKKIEESINFFKEQNVKNQTEIVCQENYLKVAETELETFKRKTFDQSILKPFEERIQKHQEEIENLKESILEKEQEVQEIRKWGLNLQNFYIYLTNKSLQVIEGYCNLFLQKIKTNLQIRLEGFKTLSDKSIREQITAVIHRDGIVEEDYRCFSGGEKGRLILSTILTFQQLINQKSKSGGLDLLWIDEILDTVDPLGMKLCLDSLEDLNKTIFLVSQVRTKGVDQNTLVVVKENGTSYLKEN